MNGTSRKKGLQDFTSDEGTHMFGYITCHRGVVTIGMRHPKGVTWETLAESDHKLRDESTFPDYGGYTVILQDANIGKDLSL
jgi:hypothetical protein